MGEPQQHIFESYLFNTVAYAKLHAHRYSTDALRCAYSRSDQEAVLGVFQAVQCEPGVFASPGRAPYGGFDLSPELTDAEVVEFVSSTETLLQKSGAQRIHMVLPPFCYSPKLGPRVLSILCRMGYVVTRQELNQALVLEPNGATKYGIHAARKRLNKARRAGVAARMLGPDEYRAGYGAIAQNRQKKARTLSMSWSDVEAMVTAFPSKLHLFGAEQDGKLLAAAICIAVSARVLYVYAWGEIAGAESLSPVCVLADDISNFARNQGFELLDLGTSSLEGIVNPGLIAFKGSLGASNSLKLWLTKVLA